MTEVNHEPAGLSEITTAPEKDSLTEQLRGEEKMLPLDRMNKPDGNENAMPLDASTVDGTGEENGIEEFGKQVQPTEDQISNVSEEALTPPKEAFQPAEILSKPDPIEKKASKRPVKRKPSPSSKKRRMNGSHGRKHLRKAVASKTKSVEDRSITAEFCVSDEEEFFKDKPHVKEPRYVGYVEKENILQCTDAITWFSKRDFLNHLRKVSIDRQKTLEAKEKKKRRSMNSLSFEEQLKLVLELSKKE